MGFDDLERVTAALAPRYTIERVIGSGGMATVYLAEDQRHHRKVAIKVLRPELGAVLGPDRFLQEVAFAARLNHPHILPLYDSGDAAGLLYYVMPYVGGESLRQKLTRDGRLSIEEAVAITRQVAAALGHAHSQGLIHRDVKPENILLHEGEAMVADFGIALAVTSAAEERLTATGLCLGTAQYMSPEQSLGERLLDGRSDVYSLGCVLYEMLTGEPPYAGPTAQAVIAKRVADPVPSVRRLRHTVPIAVEQALVKALAKVPADRFASTGAFVEALAQPAAVPPQPRSVAVLPFVNLSPDPENEYFADGITEDVIAHLAKIRALKVISRTSVMPFKKRTQSLREIGATLEVGTLLEGSVRRVGDRVRIVAQLIDAPSDQHLWAETYDRRLTDIFAIQTDVALRIAAALQAELSHDEQARIRKEPTRDIQAYQLYLQGRYCMIQYTGEGMRRSIDHYEAAIERDPTYALAYTGVAMAYAELAEIGVLAPEEAYPRGKAAAARALELDGDLGEAHCMIALIKLVYDFDWSGAEQEFQRALKLSPSSADAHDLYGRLCSAQERYDDAVALQQRAFELDPLAHRSDVATSLLRAGRYDEGERAVKRAIELDPRDPRGHATLGWVLLRKGQTVEGIAELERAVALSPGDGLWLSQLGQAYALAGRIDAARAILRQLAERSRETYVSPYHLAYVYTGLGELDSAMDCLERAYAERAGAVYGIKGSFLFEPLRAHPRFQALLRKMNLA
jgi:serine/threonine-protein kinase